MPLALILANSLIAFCYYSIAALVAAQLVRARGLNPLGLATAGIFFTCALGHSVHVASFFSEMAAVAPKSVAADPTALLRWLCATGPNTSAAAHASANHLASVTGIQLAVDALTVVPALGFLALRRRYGLLVDGEAVILDYQRSLDGERARVAERTAALASAEVRARELAEARAAAEQAAAALRLSETFLRTIITAAPVGIVTVGSDQRFRSVNPTLATMLGTTPVALQGEPFLDHIHPEDRPMAMTWVQTLPQTAAAHAPIEVRALTHNGQVVWVSLTAALLVDKPGEPTLGLGIVQDVTARRAMEERLRETQRLEGLGVLAGGIAHDFNNVLTSVLGHAELAGLHLAAEHPAQRDLNQIVVGAQHAADLVRQLLAYAGKGQISVAPVHLSALVQELIDLLQVSVGKHARLITRLDPQLPSVAADAAQLRQVVLNLLTNAAEAIGAAEGVITLTTAVQQIAPAGLAGVVLGTDCPPGPYVCLTVTDSGPGIAPEVRQRMFDPFFTTKFTGRGLGLAAVQGIIRAHQGVLAVNSEMGAGTTFQVWLPAAPESRTPPETAAVAAAPGGGTVLVIDDEAPVRAVLTAMLEHCGYDVVSAADGASGLALLPGIPSLRGAFIDLTMPGMGGVAVAAELHAQRPEIPLVLMSGYSADDLAAHADQPGVVATLAKPYRLAAVRGALGFIDRAWQRPPPSN